jgi:hypothetical protein
VLAINGGVSSFFHFPSIERNSCSTDIIVSPFAAALFRLL